MENNTNIPQDDAVQDAQPTQGKKKRTWIWIVVAAVVLIGAVVGVLFATGILGGMKGNTGVLALYQYYMDKQESANALAGEDRQMMTERFLNGPFEVDVDMDVKTDVLQGLGVPMDKIPVEMEIKYDLQDLGIKARVPGLEFFGAYFEAYMIEDELVISSMQGTTSTKIETPTEADLDEALTIGERTKAMLPFLPQDNQTMMDMLYQVAVAVPEEYTETEKDDIYSPMEDDEVQMQVITTTLDAQALGEVAARLDANLEKEDELMDTLQDMIDAFTQMFDVDDFELDDALGDLADDADEIPDIEISWSVYERNGAYVGVSFCYVDEDMNESTYTEMYEVSGNDMYQSTNVVAEDTNQTTLAHYTYEGNTFEFDGETTTVVPNGMSLDGADGDEMTVTIDIEGKGELLKKYEDNYELTLYMTVDANGLEDLGAMMEQGLSFEIEMECDCRFGDDLDMLEDNDDWNAIYDIDWEAGESLMPGLDLFGDMM